MILRIIQSLVITFLALLAFGTLIEIKLKRRKRDTRGYKLLCPLCDTVVAEVTFPSESIYIHYWHNAFQRIQKSKRKLREGEYRIECPNQKCKRELCFMAEDIRLKMEKWDET